MRCDTGVTLERGRAPIRSPRNVHCAVEAAWRAMTDNDFEQCVCAGCFEKLHERFDWKRDAVGTSRSRARSTFHRTTGSAPERMADADELDNLRSDIAALRLLIDDALDNGPPNSPLVRASARVLRDRCAQLEDLESRSGHEDAA